MNKTLKTVGLAIAAGTLVLSAMSASAADIREHVLRFATSNVEGNPQVDGLMKFAELMKEKSGGKIVVKVFTAGSLGKDIQVLSSMQGGTVDGATMNTNLLVYTDEQFAGTLGKLMAAVREHFATEKALLASNDYPSLDAHEHEGEEFEFLASEIISTENFDPDELQTFLALWCTGHIVGTSALQRPYLERQSAN